VQEAKVATVTMPTGPTGTTTIGVAIAVPAPWGAQLQDYRTALGDERAAGIPTHVTLVPPQGIDPSEQRVVEQHLEEASTANSAFRMHLRGTGTFRPVSPVVFVTVAEGISSCEALARSVRRGPLDIEREFPYHPHVTVAHHLSDDVLDRAFAELADFECDFVVDRFSLYVHDGAGWVPTRHFTLTAASDT
jgi:2'-5' RNA ligase